MPLASKVDTATMPQRLPSGAISRQIRVLALPMLGEQFVVFLVGMVDVWLAGTVSKEATAAVGTGAYMNWFVSLAVMLVCTGAHAVISRAWGAGDRKTANRALEQGLLMAIGIGIIIGSVAWIFAPQVAAFLMRTDEARELLTQYLRIDALGYLAMSVLLLVSAVLRAAGDTRTPMAVMILINVINFFVSASLVFGWFGPPQGVAGIAYGTIVARWVGGLLIVAFVIIGWRGFRLRRGPFVIQWPMIWRISRIGLPGGGDAAFLAITHVLFVRIVTMTATGDESTANYAAHIIAVRMEAITFLPAVAFMTAAATLVGQYLGAGQPDNAGRAGHIAAAQGATLTSLVAVAFFVFAEQIYAAFSDDPQVVAVGAPAFRILAFVQPFLAVAIIYVGSLRGAGDTRYTMVASLIGGFFVRLPLAYVFGVVLEGGLLGAWIGMFADNIAKFCFGLGRHLQGGWKHLKV